MRSVGDVRERVSVCERCRDARLGTCVDLTATTSSVLRASEVRSFECLTRRRAGEGASLLGRQLCVVTEKKRALGRRKLGGGSLSRLRLSLSRPSGGRDGHPTRAVEEAGGWRPRHLVDLRLPRARRCNLQLRPSGSGPDSDAWRAILSSAADCGGLRVHELGEQELKGPRARKASASRRGGRVER